MAQVAGENKTEDEEGSRLAGFFFLSGHILFCLLCNRMPASGCDPQI